MPVEQDAKIIQSVGLAMRILECLASSDSEKGVTELARELDVTKARIFRHLQTLRQLGYVSHNKSTKKDSTGIRLHLLANRVGNNLELTPAVRPCLETLRDSTGETAVFATVLGGKVTMIDFALGTNVVQFTFRPGATFNLHSSALGHISLAFGPEEYWEHLKEGEFEQDTPKTITDPKELKARVEKARISGWTIVPQQAVLGINAIAVPVFFHDNRYAGAIAIVGSSGNIPDVPPQQMIDQLSIAGQQASRNLGWRPDAD